jgi:hypothetical protein
VFADSLAIPRPGPVGKVSDAELIALAIAWSGLRSQVADQISASPRPRQSGGRSPTQ